MNQRVLVISLGLGILAGLVITRTRQEQEVSNLDVRFM